MRDIESRYIEQIDKAKFAGQGKASEEIVINFFRRSFPNMEVRQATAKEDAGQDKSGKMIDAVVYMDQKPALALQITSTVDRDQRIKKQQEMMLQPFLRLEEMKPLDPAIPRVLIYVDARDVKAYSENKDLTRLAKLGESILESTLLSLRFDLTQTKNPKETERLRQLLGMIDEHKRILGEKEKGKTN